MVRLRPTAPYVFGKWQFQFATRPTRCLDEGWSYEQGGSRRRKLQTAAVILGHGAFQLWRDLQAPLAAHTVALAAAAAPCPSHAGPPRWT
jgi:hypothetical protein